ncbi:hypothetical protein HMPREF3171_05800 [Corynebacterium sp. HMSC08F01]|uniref:hypothetical protein n=1 Tax=Corynebacterium sp. HMSC08F01 TaxID=1581139 RepID=UPI0008A375C4|nr:hypothetical protein [Corynebacterium sp. HMSC08F01]OFT29704.1 hypothetical protein HMPREF3171_05800 [Corynebacterium sp. HMSC08F01]
MRSGSVFEILVSMLRELRVTNALLERGVDVLQDLNRRSDAALIGVMANNEQLASDILAAQEVRAAQISAANADDDFRRLLDEEGDPDE